MSFRDYVTTPVEQRKIELAMVSLLLVAAILLWPLFVFFTIFFFDSPGLEPIVWLGAVCHWLVPVPILYVAYKAWRNFRSESPLDGYKRYLLFSPVLFCAPFVLAALASALVK